MAATKVTLRRKPLSDNMESLYLDFYPAFRNPDTGKLTRREFLNIKVYSTAKTEQIYYTDDKGNELSKIVPIYHDLKKDEKGNPIQKRVSLNELQKRHNREQEQFAENIRLKRQTNVNEGDYNFISKKAIKSDFLAFFMDIAESKNLSNKATWISAYKQLFEYTGGKLFSKEIGIEFCENYKKHLEDKVSLKQNTKVSYFIKLKIAIKDADKKGFVKSGTYADVEEIGMKEEDTNIEFLTLDELAILKNIPCSNELYKQAALFSASVGLRRSDCIAFSWGDIKSGNDGLYIDFSQQKTAGILHAPLNETALSILGERKADNVKPFGELLKTKWATQDKELHKWVKDAGIHKKITFHCFRHSYAVALISKGTDIFTVSKMLGHKSVMTTVKNYAKVMNKDKKKAVDNINF
ncbi:MAG: tyrosine-type recombinase/integrase [Salinivirgaceae bacterium]|jgi:integrase|nr:tyrosine-type recombinase/integrase [Salinivirgaceae bacterium]